MKRVTTIKGEQIDLHPGMAASQAMLRELALDGVDLSGSSLRNCFFNQSSLVGANLSNSDLRGCVFWRADLSGADLTGSILDDCYLEEVIHSADTKWPENFELAGHSGPAGTGHVTAYAEDVSSSDYTCSLGLVPKCDLFAETSPAKSIVPRGALGRVSAETNARLFARLAVNVYTALHTDREDPSYSYFDYEQGLVYMNDFTDGENLHDDVIFTQCVFMLMATGLRFDEIKQDGSLRATFRPLRSAREFAKGDALHVLKIIYDIWNGVDHGDSDDVKDLLARTPMSRLDETFWLDDDHHFDLSAAFDEDTLSVPLVGGPRPTRTPQEALLEILIDMVEFTSGSRLTNESSEPDTDNGELDDLGVIDGEDAEDESDADEVTLESYQALMILRLLGIKSAKWSHDGVIAATLRPPTNIKRLQVDLNFIDDDEEGESETTPWWFDDYVARPGLGLFESLLP